MATNDYQAPGVYLPAASGVIHHTPRDRPQVDPDGKGDGKSVAKTTDVPPSQAVRKADELTDSYDGSSSSDGKADLGPKTDPANLVRAQEIARRADDEAKQKEDKKRSAVASAAEMVGAPEELVRLDQNRDGRIDQLELQHAFRAEGEDSTYAALSNYRKALGFSDSSDKQTEKPEKLFADEIAAAEKAKLSETKQTDDDQTAAKQGERDSTETALKSEQQVKIVV